MDTAKLANKYQFKPEYGQLHIYSHAEQTEFIEAQFIVSDGQLLCLDYTNVDHKPFKTEIPLSDPELFAKAAQFIEEL
jgi:hypothetical protein